jgi:hypothetical protein
MDIQSANRQHPVPQNVMDVEFKLIGELTIRQFSYLLLFALIAAGIAKTGLPVIFKYPLVPFFVIVGLTFAFLPFHDITMDKWVVNYFKAVTTPRLRVWKHTPKIPYFFTLDSTKQKEEINVVRSNKQRGSIDDFLKGRKDVTDTDFTDEADLVEKESEFFKKVGLSTQPKKYQEKSNSSVATPPVSSNNALEDMQHTQSKFASVAVSKPDLEQINKPIQNTPNSTQDIPNTLPVQEPEKPSKQEEIEKEVPKIQDYSSHIKELDQLKQKLIKDIEKNRFKVMEGKQKEVEKIAITPDQNRGQVPIAQEIKPFKQKTQPHKDLKQETKKVKPKTSTIQGFLSKLGSISTTKKKKEEVLEPTHNKPEPSNTPKAQVNLLKGNTEDSNKNMLPDTIVIIKNAQGDSIRALKTNSLGEFELATPLDNGMYSLEAIKEGFQFTPIAVKALGEELLPVKLVGTSLPI